ncbi:hypothetical protein QU487_24115, partial [Crenobacter sp. SG2305]|uniref:hypothetical protein n=1 Tax=Crenobacter oryzisoli TaxID=3056844 RepID=UPI0025AB2BE6
PRNGAQCGTTVARSGRLDKPRVVTCHAKKLDFLAIWFSRQLLRVPAMQPAIRVRMLFVIWTSQKTGRIVEIEYVSFVSQRLQFDSNDRG